MPLARAFCFFFSGKLFYKSNRKLFSCVCIAWYKHSRRWENSRQLYKPSENVFYCLNNWHIKRNHYENDIDKSNTIDFQFFFVFWWTWAKQILEEPIWIKRALRTLGWGGGGTPLFGLDGCVSQNRVWFSESWVLNRLYNFAVWRLRTRNL